MAFPTIPDKVRDILMEHLSVDADQITPTALIIDDLGADSLDRIELVMACEETFDILIPDVDAKTMIRVQDVVMYIEARLTANT